MTTKKQRLSFRFIQVDGVITISAYIPEEQVKHCGKLIWGIIGSGTIWVATHMPLFPTQSKNLPTMLPPASTQVQNPLSTTDK